MNYDELLKKYPEAAAEAEAVGAKKERERVSKALALKARREISCRDTIAERIERGILDGDSYLDITLAAARLLDADLESVGPIGTGRETTASGEPATPGARGSAATGGWKPGQIEEV